MDTNCRRYLKEFGGSMAAYVIIVFASVWLLKHNAAHSPLRFVLAVLPVVPAAFAMWAAIRYFRGLDELQRRIQLEGLAFSFLATCLIALSWGFLQNAGLPQADVIWVAPLLVFLWGVGCCIAKRRYQ
jgi:hypothetical protein